MNVDVISCQTIKEIYKAIDPVRIFGMSATWEKGDNTQLASISILGDQIIDIPATEFIEKGWLAKPYIKFVNAPKVVPDGKDYHSIYRSCIVENEGRNKLIVKNTKDLLAKGYRVLCLYKLISHGEILAEMFADAGIEVEILSGKDNIERRDDAKERMQSGKLKAILASQIFDLGVDISSLSALVLAGSGKSIVRSTQRIGRIIRKYPGKDKVAVVDYIDDVKYLKQHSRARFDTYKLEPGFEVQWPGNKESRNTMSKNRSIKRKQQQKRQKKLANNNHSVKPADHMDCTCSFCPSTDFHLTANMPDGRVFHYCKPCAKQYGVECPDCANNELHQN